MPDRYDLEEHRHRFAYWAAASAAFIHPEKGLTVLVARAALEKSLRASTLAPAKWPTTADAVDARLDEWTMEVLDCLRAATSNQQTQPKYGRAAKLVAVYLKAMVVTGGHADTNFGKLLHPPIDSNLLKALKVASPPNQPNLKEAVGRALRTGWSNLERGDYLSLVRALRDSGLDNPAFWYLERYWKP